MDCLESKMHRVGAEIWCSFTKVQLWICYDGTAFVDVQEV